MSIKINSKMYDAVKFMEHHPGGKLFIKMFAGQDATEPFYVYHRKVFPHSKMKQFAISSKSDSKSQVSCSSKSQVEDEKYKDYFELVQIINETLEIQGFAPNVYFIKMFVLLSLTFYIEYHMLCYGKQYLLSFLLGLCYALIGLNIQHDANHGAISSKPWINFVLGLTQNYIGGDHLNWIKRHVTEHHIVCNHYEKDPDIEGGTILRFHEKTKRLTFHIFQCIYVWILLSLYGFLAVFSPSKISINLLNISFKIFWFLRMIVIPFYLHYESLDVYKEIFCLVLTISFAGFYLGFFFILSHNFVGAKHFDDKDLENVSMLRRQVESSSNVGGSLLCFINGGLNYQIEHHLFPRINHSHYPKIAPIVKAYCNKNHIQYKHFPTIYQNFKSTTQYLFDLGCLKKKM